MWDILENLRSASRESHEVDIVDNVHMCSMLEQTVCLLGQASVAVDHQRRKNTAVKITGDYKKAKVLMEENSEALEKSGDELFGDRFIKVSKKSGKRRKEANEVADAFQPDKKIRRKTHQNRPFSSSFKPRFRQPFQEGPSSRFKEGRRPGYKFNRITKSTRTNLTGISTKPQIMKGATLTNAEEELNSFSVINLARSTIFREILNINLQIIDKQNAVPVGGRINISNKTGKESRNIL